MSMIDRFKNVLVNPTWEEIVDRDPFVAFSHYLSGRIHVLLAIADEITENLDCGFSAQAIDCSRVERAESLMWLGCLGPMKSFGQCAKPKAASLNKHLIN